MEDMRQGFPALPGEDGYFASALWLWLSKRKQVAQRSLARRRTCKDAAARRAPKVCIASSI